MKYIIFLFFYCSCLSKTQKNADTNHSPNDSGYHKKNYDSIIIAIDKKVGANLTYHEQLLNYPEFVDIFKHDSLYLNEAIEFLRKNKDTTGWQNEINYVAMQNLSLVNYLKFYKVYVEQFEQGKIGEQSLEEVTLPHFLKYQILVRNYNDPDVINILNSLLQKKDISDKFKDLIIDIKSGEVLKGMRYDDPDFN